jgi:hypothetical protein
MKPVIQTVIKSARDHAVAQPVVNPEKLLLLLLNEMSESDIIALESIWKREEAKGIVKWTYRDICVYFKLIDKDGQLLGKWKNSDSNSVHSIKFFITTSGNQRFGIIWPSRGF